MKTLALIFLTLFFSGMAVLLYVILKVGAKFDEEMEKFGDKD